MEEVQILSPDHQKRQETQWFPAFFTDVTLNTTLNFCECGFQVPHTVLRTYEKMVVHVLVALKVIIFLDVESPMRVEEKSPENQSSLGYIFLN